MIIGTCHFVNRRFAMRYYRAYNYANDVSQVVDRKLKEGEIKLGPPKIKSDERTFINDEGRFCIEVN